MIIVSGNQFFNLDSVAQGAMVANKSGNTLLLQFGHGLLPIKFRGDEAVRIWTIIQTRAAEQATERY